jgi:predicted metal-dependent peptidase
MCGGSGQVDDDSDKEGKNQKSSKGGKGTKKVQEKDGQSGGGEGKEGKKKPCPACGGSGKLHGKTVLQTTDDHSKHRKLTEIEKAVIQETINNAKTRSWGSISGNMQDEIKGLIKTKKIPWQRKLAMLMSKYVNEPGSIYENTWSKRNRRSLPLPGIRKLSKKIVVTVDTSGSIGQDDLMKFFGQIEKIIKDYSVMTLIQWDTEVQKVEQYKKGAWKSIEIRGRGGTDPQALYNLLHEDFKYLSVVVNFTDTWFSWDFDHYGIPTIWAVVNNPSFEAPFGKQVMIEAEDGSDDFGI